ncbi:MAG: ABC transporter ATP-binding protein [Lentisphaerae bacterium]|nr:MAG: ABC transporter ATP-binding protein [Lentisphaerota bacterium]
MADKAAISVRQLTKCFGNFTALEDITFSVEQGRICGFIGPNGAGKTTTLRILATLMQPDAGEINILGYNLLNIADAKLIRYRIGFMPDSFGLYPDMTASEYLEFFAAAYRIELQQRQRVVDEILEIIDLSDKRDVLVCELSRGMQQRLSLGRCLVHSPDILLLDEPASGLDPRARIELMELLRELREMGKTILISSHILAELHLLCDDIVLIDHGAVRYHGSIDEARQIFHGRHNCIRLRCHSDDPMVDPAELIGRVDWVERVAKQKNGDLLVWVDVARKPHDLAQICLEKELRLEKLLEDEPHLGDIFMHFISDRADSSSKDVRE